MEFNKIAFISDFLAEFKNKLDITENHIFALRKDNSNSELLDAIINETQDLKSLAYMMGFYKLEKITNQLRTIFSDIKGERLKFSSDIVKLFIFISNELRNTLDKIEQGKNDDVENYEFISENLKRAVDGEPFATDLNKIDDEDINKLTGNKDNQHIRVGVNRIDEILQNFDKMIMREFRLKKLLYSLFEDVEGEIIQKHSRKIRQIKETIELIENQSLSIQDNVISIRKLPFDMILQPFKRAAVSKAIELNRNIKFDIPYTDIKIDNSILERIPFILECIVVNALEHGIESEEERVACGKDKVGEIKIDVKKLLNRIILTISDDGRGIDYEKIRQRALELYPENEIEIQSLDQKNLIEYIFQPDFVSNGNDEEKKEGLFFVRDEIDKIKGKIKVDSVVGKGTSFELSLPLSLATQEGLFVKAGQYKLLILTHYISEILTVKNESFITIQSETVIPVRNELIPIYNSKSILGKGTSESGKDDVSVVILEYMETKIAVIMDEILNYTTVVVKPLPRIFRNFKALQGVVFDEDYKIVPILNIPDLIRRFKVLNEYELKSFEVQNAKKNRSVLIVDSSPTTRQIEEDIFETENYRVETCGDGILSRKKINKEKENI